MEGLERGRELDARVREAGRLARSIAPLDARLEAGGGRILALGSTATTLAPRSVSRRDEMPVPAPRSATVSARGSPSPASTASIASGG